MATRGNTNGITSTVSRICSRMRVRIRLVSNISPSPPSARVDDDRCPDGEDEQDDRQRRPVADLGEGDAHPVDLGAEELGRVARPAPGDEERDVDQAFLDILRK